MRRLLAGPLAPGLRRDVMAVGGHAGALAGLTARFMGRDHDAVGHLRLAGQLAEGAGESHLQALALVWIADAYSGVQRAGETVGDPAHVTALLGRAEVLAGPAGPPAVRALVYLRLAEEVAASLEATRAAAWLERADSAFSIAAHVPSQRRIADLATNHHLGRLTDLRQADHDASSLPIDELPAYEQSVRAVIAYTSAARKIESTITYSSGACTSPPSGPKMHVGIPNPFRM